MCKEQLALKDSQLRELSAKSQVLTDRVKILESEVNRLLTEPPQPNRHPQQATPTSDCRLCAQLISGVGQIKDQMKKLSSSLPPPISSSLPKFWSSPGARPVHDRVQVIPQQQYSPPPPHASHHQQPHSRPPPAPHQLSSIQRRLMALAGLSQDQYQTSHQSAPQHIQPRVYQQQQQQQLPPPAHQQMSSSLPPPVLLMSVKVPFPHHLRSHPRVRPQHHRIPRNQLHPRHSARAQAYPNPVLNSFISLNY